MSSEEQKNGAAENDEVPILSGERILSKSSLQTAFGQNIIASEKLREKSLRK